jgi:hypothetical protein
MENMTSSIWKKGINNFNIIHVADDGVNFTIIRPYSPVSCSDISRILVNSLKDGKFLNDTRTILFPKGKEDNGMNHISLCHIMAQGLDTFVLDYQA